jgi:hypothetical protein
MNRSRVRRKAQVWSLDFVVSMVIFLLALIPLFFVWDHMNVQNQQDAYFNEAENAALSISDALLRTKGLPEGWSDANVEVVGLASEEGALNMTKVASLMSMGSSEYNRTRAILTGGFDFFLNITDLNGTSYGTIGSKPEGRMVVPVERYCIANERIAKLELAIVV